MGQNVEDERASRTSGDADPLTETRMEWPLREKER